MFRKLLLASFSIFLVFVAMAPQDVFAENQKGFSASLSPGKKDIELLPGQSKDYFITFTNNLDSDIEQNFQIEVQDFFYSDGGGVNFIDPSRLDDISKSISSWVSVPSRIVLKGGGEYKIPVKVKVPSDAPGGDKYGVVLIRSAAPEGVAAVGVSGQMTSVIVLKVLGGEKVEKTGLVENFKIKTRSRARNTANFTLDFRNTSNEYYEILARVEVYESQDDLTPIKVLRKTEKVFPNVLKKIDISLGDLGDDFGEGTYFVKFVLQEDVKTDNPLVFAKYEDSFQYNVPLAPGVPEPEVKIDDVEKVVYQGPSPLDYIKEIVIYVGGFLIVIIILIKVLFFSGKKKD